ncbi:predicted protein [Micromonas commoda]|uniref:Zinc finger CHCC-type domain-containing protein n=1 Tax=Micromonas commoda (strain RCC299 / NOUM17 / CCMP2709) TaxID=296587 RepID=C1E3B8_MICCC|nr:predicted protein [Micromonas commoda]ACO62905.1 predicted protein [Micromonas commoda]|eukprot:XP_002501647.1 predicted protein [Micromonas commoda]
MALRRAAAIIARLPNTAAHTRFAPAGVHSRDMSGGLERFREGQPVQSKRPAYDERDTAHTDKWLEAAVPSPMEMINEIEPIPIHADRVSCKSKGACMDRYGERVGLGAPNTYYQLNSTTKDAPVKCKYCGLRFYGVH